MDTVKDHLNRTQVYSRVVTADDQLYVRVKRRARKGDEVRFPGEKFLVKDIPFDELYGYLEALWDKAEREEAEAEADAETEAETEAEVVGKVEMISV